MQPCSPINILEKFYFLNHLFYILNGDIQLTRKYFQLPYRINFNYLTKIFGLLNHNICFLNHIPHDPIGT
jgi:hypothetical protein